MFLSTDARRIVELRLPFRKHVLSSKYENRLRRGRRRVPYTVAPVTGHSGSAIYVYHVLWLDHMLPSLVRISRKIPSAFAASSASASGTNMSP